jgi:hypothetical protein
VVPVLPVEGVTPEVLLELEPVLPVVPPADVSVPPVLPVPEAPIELVPPAPPVVPVVPVVPLPPAVVSELVPVLAVPLVDEPVAPAVVEGLVETGGVVLEVVLDSVLSFFEQAPSDRAAATANTAAAVLVRDVFIRETPLGLFEMEGTARFAALLRTLGSPRAQPVGT